MRRNVGKLGRVEAQAAGLCTIVVATDTVLLDEGLPGRFVGALRRNGHCGRGRARRRNDLAAFVSGVRPKSDTALVAAAVATIALVAWLLLAGGHALLFGADPISVFG